MNITINKNLYIYEPSKKNMGNRITKEELYIVRRSISFVTKKYFKNCSIQEDVASECVIKIIDKFEMYDSSKAKLSTWVNRVASNYCIDILRKQKKDVEFYSNTDIASLNIADENKNIFENEGVTIVYSYIKKMFEDFKKIHIEILLFCKLEGESYKEASVKFNTSVENIRTIVFRVINSIRNKIYNDGNEDLILSHLNLKKLI